MTKPEANLMTTSNSWDVISQAQERNKARMHPLSEPIRQWDKPIREKLRRLAEVLWPSRRLWGWYSIRDYRLRRRATSEDYTWWIEHDLPPYDRYQCAAYRVQLSVDEAEKPYLTIQSGTAIYPVNPLTIEMLNTILDRASADPPLLVSRAIGPALDP